MYEWLVPSVLSLVGAYQGYNAGSDVKGLAKQQELIGEENAMLAERELREDVRRQEKEDRKLRGSALARAAASGARIEGTVSGYLDYIQDEQDENLDWMKTAGASRIRLDLQTARMNAKATKIRGETQQTSSLMQGLMGVAVFAGKSGLFSSWGTTTPYTGGGSAYNSANSFGGGR